MQRIFFRTSVIPCHRSNGPTMKPYACSGPSLEDRFAGVNYKNHSDVLWRLTSAYNWRSGGSLCVVGFFVAVMTITALLAIPASALAAGAPVRKPPVTVGPATRPSRSPVPSAVPGIGHEQLFGGCGKGRFRDPKTNQCRGPGDINRATTSTPRGQVLAHGFRHRTPWGTEGI
jgi:hypothetical protein